MLQTEIARFKSPAPSWPVAIAAADKALRFVPKCLHCGKAKNQHRAFTGECPIGKRTPTGYARYASQRFADAAFAAAATPPDLPVLTALLPNRPPASSGEVAR